MVIVYKGIQRPMNKQLNASQVQHCLQRLCGINGTSSQQVLCSPAPVQNTLGLELLVASCYWSNTKTNSAGIGTAVNLASCKLGDIFPSNLEAMASNLIAMASILGAMASNFSRLLLIDSPDSSLLSLRYSASLELKRMTSRCRL